MSLAHTITGNGSKSAQELTYTCQESDCLVRYIGAEGYFIAAGEGAQVEKEIMPRVRCPRDTAPMYLGEVRPPVTSFPLWRCPLCGATSVAGQVLMAAT